MTAREKITLNGISSRLDEMSARLSRIETRLFDPDNGMIVEAHENTKFRRSFRKAFIYVACAFAAETIAFVFVLAKEVL